MKKKPKTKNWREGEKEQAYQFQATDQEKVLEVCHYQGIRKAKNHKVSRAYEQVQENKILVLAVRYIGKSSMKLNRRKLLSFGRSG